MSDDFDSYTFVYPWEITSEMYKWLKAECDKKHIIRHGSPLIIIFFRSRDAIVFKLKFDV